jgi:preprotein translocase subunit SecY
VKHLNRFANGIIIFTAIDAFDKWQYKKNTLIFVGIMVLVYLIGCWIEIVGLAGSER